MDRSGHGVWDATGGDGKEERIGWYTVKINEDWEIKLEWGQVYQRGRCTSGGDGGDTPFYPDPLLSMVYISLHPISSPPLSPPLASHTPYPAWSILSWPPHPGLIGIQYISSNPSFLPSPPFVFHLPAQLDFILPWNHCPHWFSLHLIQFLYPPSLTLPLQPPCPAWFHYALTPVLIELHFT